MLNYLLFFIEAANSSSLIAKLSESLDDSFLARLPPSVGSPDCAISLLNALKKAAVFEVEQLHASREANYAIMHTCTYVHHMYMCTCSVVTIVTWKNHSLKKREVATKDTCKMLTHLCIKLPNGG